MTEVRRFSVVEGSLSKTAIVISTYILTFLMAHITTAGVGRLFGATLFSALLALSLFFANWCLAMLGAMALFEEQGWIK